MKLLKPILKFIAVIVFFITCSKANAQMFWNQTCQFAGSSNSYVSVPNSTGVNLTGDFTLEAWINPTTVTGTTDKGIISKGSTLGASLRYSMKISKIGRLTISTNGIIRDSSTAALTANVWTHVAVTYTSATNVFVIYLNGAVNKTSGAIAGSAPSANTDSLFIGIAGTGNFFTGQMDEVRMWSRAISATEISQLFRATIGTSSGVNYFSLVLSFPFQKNNSGGTLFSLTDWTGNGNNGFNRNVTAVSQTGTQYVTTSPNECLFFQGTGEYAWGLSNSLVSPASSITIEAWVYPRSYAATPTILTKSSGTSYKIGLSTSGKLQYYPNGVSSFLESKTAIPQQRWSHITAQYNGTTTSIYVNGVLDTATNSITGAMGTTTDTLLIGCELTSGLPTKFFNGYVDELRISDYIKTGSQINDYLYKSIDSVNQPNPANTNVSYNFDGMLVDNGDGGPRLYFSDSARFSQISGISNQPVSPMLRDDSRPFVNGFNMKTSNKRVPLSGSSGTTDDSINIPFNVNISDVNIFVAINHTDETNLDVSLIAPNGDVAILSNDGVTVGAYDHLVTIFDDQALNSVNSTSFTSFTPSIKPEGNLLSTFGGDQTQGTWILRVVDDGGADTGRINAWGIQFNNSTTPNRVTSLNFTSIIQGFWDSTTMVQDTMRVYLRNTVSPYTITDSAKVFLSSSGNGLVSFLNTGNSTKYITLKHRNSLQTWSAGGVVFQLDSTTVYNFTTSNTQAFGNNEILYRGKYCIYNGDYNKDGTINLTDIVATFNDSQIFLVGYVNSDYDGDNFVNLNDIIIAFNNSSVFAHVITPP